jgi:putative ABC transport system permease protein
MVIQLLLAWRYLHVRWLRTGLTTLAITLGVMILFGMQGIIPAVRASFQQNLQESAHTVDLIVSRSNGGFFPETVQSQVRQIPGVALVMPVLEEPLRLPQSLALAGEPMAVDHLIINGVDPSTAAQAIPITPLEGRWFTAGEQNAALIRTTLAERVGFAIGDTLRLPTATGTLELTIIGILPKRPLIGDEEIFVPLHTSQTIFNRPEQINALIGVFREGQDAPRLRQTILAELGETYAIGAVEAGGSEWDSVLQIGEVAFLLFGGLAIAMSGFIIFNSCRTSVAERQQDIGMLRAIGATRHMVIAIVVCEGLVLGMIGTTIGIGLGFVLVSLLVASVAPIWADFFGAPLAQPVFEGNAWILAITLGLGIPWLSSLIPAQSAGTLPPLAALRPLDLRQTKQQADRRSWIGGTLVLGAFIALLSGEPRVSIFGALLCLIGLTLLGSRLVPGITLVAGQLLERLFPHAGRLAQANIQRNPERAALTASAMMSSLAILIALAGLGATFTSGLLGYLERSMRADYMLAPQAAVLGQGDVGASPALAEQLRALPGIQAVTTMREASATIGTIETKVIGIDPATFAQLAGLTFTAGDAVQVYSQLATDQAVIVNGVFAAQAGKTIGDSIPIETLHGVQAYRIVGIGIDYLNSRAATIYISQEQLASAFGQQNDSLLLLQRTPDADQRSVEAALQEVTKTYPAFSLVLFEEWRDEQIRGNQLRSNILSVLTAILAIPSLLALTNTLGMNVVERTREIGVLRAIGATRRQIQQIIVAESLLLVLFGIAGGILAGIMLGYALTGAINRSGLIFTYTFPWVGIGIACIVGLALGIIGGFLPARYAARIEIIRAIQTY